MAFGTSSKIFSAFITDSLNNTTAFDMNSDTLTVALYGNTGTPDQTVASANTAYNAGQWTSGNEVTATGWTAGGLTIASVTSGFSSNVYSLDGADRAGGASDTVTAAHGVLVYDNTLTTPVADQGICYNAFGSSQGVTGGTFTVVWGTAILQLTL